MRSHLFQTFELFSVATFKETNQTRRIALGVVFRCVLVLVAFLALFALKVCLFKCFEYEIVDSVNFVVFAAVWTGLFFLSQSFRHVLHYNFLHC